MRIFVTGATGFVGKRVVAKLIERGHRPACLVRPGSEQKLGDLLRQVDVVHGSIYDIAAWQGHLAGVEAIIHLIGIIRELPKGEITFSKLHTQATADLVAAAVRLGIRRFLYMSALGVRPDARTEYHRSKFRAEEQLRGSGLAWTIFRPSIISGDGNQAVAEILKLIRHMPLVPVIGNGQYRLQPVDLDNVAEGFAKAVNSAATFERVYEIGGPESFSYNRVLELIAAADGRKLRVVHVPVVLVRIAAKLLQRFESFPLTEEQLTMLLEGSTTSSTDFFGDLQIEPIRFEDSLRKYIRPQSQGG